MTANEARELLWSGAVAGFYMPVIAVVAFLVGWYAGIRHAIKLQHFRVPIERWQQYGAVFPRRRQVSTPKKTRTPVPMPRRA